MHRKELVKLISITALILVSACDPQSESNNTADIVLFGGSVLTMDATESIAEAIAIRDKQIIAIGSAVNVRKLAGPDTRLVKLHGQTITPGLIDTHNHFSWGALDSLSSLDIEYPAVKSVDDILDNVRSAAAQFEPGEWIIGSKWDAGKLIENRDLNAADLDSVSPNHPVWLLHTSAHYGVANSRALEIAGVTKATPNPDGGVIVRDVDGNPTGILTDQAMRLITDLTPAVSTEDFVRAVTAEVSELNAVGITTIKDPEIDQRQWDAYQTIHANDDLSVRVFTLWRVPDTMAEAKNLLQHIAPITRPRDESTSDEIISGGVKIYIDGSGTARTAWMHDDWNEDFDGVDEGNTGLTYLDTNTLLEQIRLFHDAEIHIGTHAIGDRAIDFTMESYARVLEDNPVSGLRHSIIHSNLPTDHAMDLMVDLQKNYDTGYPEVQPAFLWWIGDAYAGNFGPERSLRVLPLRTFEERGIRWAGGSDYDVSPFAPVIALWAASARQTMLGTHGDSPWGGDESVGVHDTLRAYTSVAARQVFLEDKIGSIEVGKLADLVVWDRDLLATPIDELREAAPTLTMMNGEIVFQADD